MPAAVPGSASRRDNVPISPPQNPRGARLGWGSAQFVREEVYKRGSGRHFLAAINSQMDRLCFSRVNFLLRLYMGPERREQSAPASCQ